MAELNIHKEQLTHFVLIEALHGDFVDIQNHIKQLFSDLADEGLDYFVREYEQMLVEDAREVTELTTSGNMGKGTSKVILLYADNVNNNAQNALLKTFEEPRDGVHIFLVTPSISQLLPTVLSRASVFGGLNISRNLGAEFINMNINDRLNKISKIVKEKDKGTMLNLLMSIESELANNKKFKETDPDKWARSMQAILNARRYIMMGGAMSKMLLESVALVL